MRQTVVGVYDSYADACGAQRALIDAGFPQADISIYAISVSASSSGGPRVYAPGGSDVRRDKPVFDQLEQLFARLFKRGEYPRETEDYREAIRRGGAIVSADVSEVQVDLACDVMRRTGAADIEERAKAWGSGSEGQTTHALDLGSSTGHERSSVFPAEQSAVQQGEPPTTGAASMSRSESPVAGEASMPRRESTVTGDTSTPGSEPSGSGGTWTQRPDFSSAHQQTAGSIPPASTRTEGGAATPSTAPGEPRTSGASDLEPARGSIGNIAGLHSGAEPGRDDTTRASRSERSSSDAGYVGDPILGTPRDADGSHDDEFRRDYDSRYANSGAPYDDYRRAYAHGATLGSDERYSGQEWQDVEPSVREHWESHYPESGWERFKAAVRHGWERVTGRS
jgi:hypothetical protein